MKREFWLWAALYLLYFTVTFVRAGKSVGFDIAIALVVIAFSAWLFLALCWYLHRTK